MNTNNLRKLALETNDGIMRGPALVAASEIDRLRSENERLTKERDEARAQVSASWIAGHAVGAGKGGCFAPNDLIDLIGEFGREVYHLLDDCETSGPVGEEIHTITEDGLRKVSAILDRIDDLPFEEPGIIIGTGDMLQTAIMQTFATPAPPTDTQAHFEDYGREKVREGMKRAAEVARKCWNDLPCEADAEYIPNAILADMENEGGK